MGKEEIVQAFLQFPSEQRKEIICTLMTKQIAKELKIQHTEALRKQVEEVLDSAIASIEDLLSAGS